MSISGDFLRACWLEGHVGTYLGTDSRNRRQPGRRPAVAEILKDRLQSFEIGNEVDLHSAYRPALPGYEAYHAAYLDYKAAIRAVLPQAAFSGPDAGGEL